MTTATIKKPCSFSIMTPIILEMTYSICITTPATIEKPPAISIMTPANINNTCAKTKKSTINGRHQPTRMPSTFSFLHKPIEKLKTATKQKRKRACHFPLLQLLKSIANFRLKEDLATHNNTFAKWRVSRVLASSVFIHNFVLADSVKLRMPPLRKSAKRYQ